MCFLSSFHPPFYVIIITVYIIYLILHKIILTPSYGYTGGCDTKEAARKGLLNLSSNYVTLKVTSVKDYDFSVINIWDCYLMGEQCTKIVHIKVNLGELTETGLLGRTLIWVPWRDEKCQVVPGVGVGPIEGDISEGGGCFLVFPGNWEAVGAIWIIYLYLIIRRSKKRR